MVAVCTASLTFSNCTFCPHSVFMCFVWIWEQTATISLHSIKWLVVADKEDQTALWGTNETYLLGVFAKQWKATISFVISVRPSVRTEELGSQFRDFHEIWHLSIFRRTFDTVQLSLKSDNNTQYFTWRPIYCTFMVTARLILLRMRNSLDKNCRENQTYVSCWITLFPWNSYRLWDNVEKYYRAGQTTDDNTPHARRILDT